MKLVDDYIDKHGAEAIKKYGIDADKVKSLTYEQWVDWQSGKVKLSEIFETKQTAMQSLLVLLEMAGSRAEMVHVESLMGTIKASYINLEKEQLEEARMNGYGEGYNEGLYDGMYK